MKSRPNPLPPLKKKKLTPVGPPRSLLLVKPGEVCFLDNYRMLHGRDIFEGSREHAVAWFGEQSEEDLRKLEEVKDRGSGNALNKALNNYVENAF